MGLLLPFGKKYHKKVLGVAPSLMQAYWPLWEAAGASTVKDHSPNGVDGTPSNVLFGLRGIGDGYTSAQFAEATENLISNPSGEVNTSGWEASAGASVVRSSEQAWHGVYSLKVQTGTGNYGRLETSGMKVSVSEGETWTAQARVFSQ